MKTYYLPAIFFLFISISSCSENMNEPNSDQTEKVDEGSDITVNNSVGLQLNEGQRWKVPPEMMGILQAQRSLLTEFTENQDSLYMRLGSDLDSLCSSLTQNCTMTGEAHNMLHEWLIPHWTLIDEIIEADSYGSAEGSIYALFISFEYFDKYFEE